MTAPERRRLSILLLVLVVIAVLSFWPSGKPGPTSPARTAAKGRVAASRAAYSADAPLPTLVPSREGDRPARVERNIFIFATPTFTPTPIPPTPQPTPVPRCGDPRYIGPCPTPPPPTATPIVPPPVPYKAMGLFGPPDHLIVALEDNGRLINAREGDVLDGRFIVLKINNESVDFRFVNLPPDITRRLPIPR